MTMVPLHVSAPPRAANRFACAWLSNLCPVQPCARLDRRLDGVPAPAADAPSVQPRPTSSRTYTPLRAGAGLGAGAGVGAGPGARRPGGAHVGTRRGPEVGRLDGGSSQGEYRREREEGRRNNGLPASAVIDRQGSRQAARPGLPSKQTSAAAPQLLRAQPGRPCAVKARRIGPRSRCVLWRSLATAGACPQPVVSLGGAGGGLIAPAPCAQAFGRTCTALVPLHGSSDRGNETDRSSPPNSVVTGVPKGVVSGGCVRAAS
jgi:hypothetical protein